MSSRYESIVLDAIPPGCARALDVGCGNGRLTRELHRRGVGEVVGIDRNEPCIERCEPHPEAAGITYLAEDVFTGTLAPASFDLVCAVASLHHMDRRRRRPRKLAATPAARAEIAANAGAGSLAPGPAEHQGHTFRRRRAAG